MAQHSELNDRAEFIGEALKEASNLVEDLNEKYREQAFPIVLRGLIDGSFATKAPVSAPIEPDGKLPQSQTATRFPAGLSVNAFFQMANPDSHVGRFVCAAYYLLHIGQIEHFSTADILEIYGKLRLKKPVNPTDTMNQCIKKVHIIDAPTQNGQKSWVITPDGESYVEELLDASANSKKSTN